MSKVSVEDNLGLVWDIINRLFGGGDRHKFLGFEKDDLFQIGCIGLMKAVDRYDGISSKFPTYAFQCIYGEIRNGIRDYNKLVRFPRRTYEIATKIMMQDRKYTITTDDVVKDFNVDEKYAQMIMVCLHYSSVSGSTIIHHDEGSEIELMNTLEDEEADVERKVLSSVELEQRLSILTDTEKRVVELSLDGLTQKEISSIVGISQIHVSRLKKKSVEKIQKRFDIESTI